MITCKPEYLLQRCFERGYSIESVQPCVVSDDGDTITVDETHPAYPHLRQGQHPPIKQNPTPPGTLDKAVNFAKAAAAHLAAGAPRCTDEQIAERYAICQTCEHLVDSACVKCGCPVVRERKFISKLAWADQGCPEGKWGPVYAE